MGSQPKLRGQGQLLSNPQGQLKVGISRHRGDAVRLVEPVVWGAACPLCRGSLTKAHKGLLTSPSQARLASPGLLSTYHQTFGVFLVIFLWSSIIKNILEGLSQHGL